MSMTYVLGQHRNQFEETTSDTMCVRAENVWLWVCWTVACEEEFPDVLWRWGVQFRQEWSLWPGQYIGWYLCCMTTGSQVSSVVLTKALKMIEATLTFVMIISSSHLTAITAITSHRRLSASASSNKRNLHILPTRKILVILERH